MVMERIRSPLDRTMSAQLLAKSYHVARPNLRSGCLSNYKECPPIRAFYQGVFSTSLHLVGCQGAKRPDTALARCGNAWSTIPCESRREAFGLLSLRTSLLRRHVGLFLSTDSWPRRRMPCSESITCASFSESASSRCVSVLT